MKNVIMSSILGALFITSVGLAGPSVGVHCNDPARKTKLDLFDVNPEFSVISISGVHNQLPKAVQSFGTNQQFEGKLTVTRYRPYEVELTANTPIALKSQDALVGIVERIIIENHSKLEVPDARRTGAAILVMDNGLRLRFNRCTMLGNTALKEWEKTFKLGQ